MKKFVVFVLCAMLSVTALFGCSKQDQGGTSDTVVDVRVYKAGYGVEWMHAAKEKFEELYKDKGYKINIIEESSSVPAKVAAEILNKKNAVDLYITGEDNFAIYLKNSKSFYKSYDEVVLENLNDVYSSKAIKFDGSEESITIDEKINASLKNFLKFKGTTDKNYDKYKGNYYAFPWASGASGLFMNKSVFEKFDIEIPRTTDELIKAYKKICPENKDGVPTPKETGVYPMSYGGKNAGGFWLFCYDTFFAQYSGVEAERNFWQCIPAEGSVIANGYDVYKDQGILEALKVTEKLCDDNYCAYGTNQQDDIKAQLQVLDGKAAITPSGNWIYNEMKLNSSGKVDNIVMMKMPIISALGTKLGISDPTLSAVVKGVDDGKSDEDIASECSTTPTVVAEIRKARGLYFDYSVNHVALIPSYSSSKDVAKLFLRFLASDDNLDLYKTKAYSSLPFKYASESKVQVNDFVKSVDEVMSYGNGMLLCEDISTSPIRQANLACFCNYVGYANVFLSLSRRIITSQEIYDSDIVYAEENWELLLRQAGLG